MSTYAAERTSLSRRPIIYIEIDLDVCQRTFGSSPCLATGAKCYNTFNTCKYITAFSKSTPKTYRFCSNDAPLPFSIGERPYIRDVKHLPTEIKDNITLTGKYSITMLDEPDTDVGIDPYLSTRTPPITGTFWKKLLARNPNYKNRRCRIYEAFYGNDYTEFTTHGLVFDGLLDTITFNGDGTVSVSVADKFSVLKDIEIPASISLEVAYNNGDPNGATPIDAAVIVLSGKDVSQLPSTGYVLVDKNIIRYTAVSGNALTGCTWGQFSTAKVELSAGAKVQLVYRFAPQHPFETLVDILELAGYTEADIDQDSFAAFDSAVEPAGDRAVANKLGWRDWPEPDCNISAVITETVKLTALVMEIAELLTARIWVNEDSKIQITKALPNKPGRTYRQLTDEYNVLQRSDVLTIAEDRRLTRCRIYWGKYAIPPNGSGDDPFNFRYVDMVIDADAENTALYGDAVQTKDIFTRWLNTDCAPSDPLAYMTRVAKTIALRNVARHRAAPQLLEVQVELADSDIRVGDIVQATTDTICDRFGNGLVAWPFLVVRRERIDKASFRLQMEKLSDRRIIIIGPASMTDYAAATVAQREYGYIGNASNLMSTDEVGYHIY